MLVVETNRSAAGCAHAPAPSRRRAAPSCRAENSRSARRLRAQSRSPPPGGGRLESVADATLVAVEIGQEADGETEQPAGAAAIGRRLDTDHVGAGIGEHHAAGEPMTVRVNPRMVMPSSGSIDMLYPHSRRARSRSMIVTRAGLRQHALIKRGTIQIARRGPWIPAPGSLSGRSAKWPCPCRR